MIVALTPNPAVDVTARLGQVRVGETHRLSDLTTRAGGKGVNTAAVATAMGRDAIAVLHVGSESRATVEHDLGRRGIRATLIDSLVPTRRSLAVVDDDGEATVFNEEGADPGADVWDEVVAAASRSCSRAQDVLVVSGSLPPGAPPGIVNRLARAGAGTVVLDTRGEDLIAALGESGAALPRLVAKPNLAEARETLSAAGVAAGSQDALWCACSLLDLGAWCAVVSDGPRGLVLATRDEGGSPFALSARLREPVTGNPTGAGDALTAALAAHLGQAGTSPEPQLWEEAARVGVAWSAAAVIQPVAGEVDPADVEHLLPAVVVETG
ncbi:1-phosphofructokinase family hexose kinase [Marihabitans asiaticum]|uniref:Carbohydrate kinase PfkB domain-containing protein n=1 Tax=Marihabitans asiaticum TaxID=415218 RepID=A0A560WGT3_9MICO|nr:PfkB family carbohydrate kinase [Marihabitans asiaticum]TWD16901.1 hypothetical protein FB557_0447 [Marihabitans asiaticum]